MERPSANLPVSDDLVCWSHLRWNFVFQRPQHLMVRWARTKRVFFVEEPMTTDGLARLEIRRDASGVHVVTPALPAGLHEEERNAVLSLGFRELFAEHGIARPVSWYYSPLFLKVSRHLEASVVVYDCMDELSLFKGASPDLCHHERELLTRAHVVLTGGQSLYEAKRDLHGNVHLLPSSVDVPHFAQAREPQSDPPDQADIPHLRIGFHGVIDERMDLALIDELAALRPDWHLVLVGPLVKVDESHVPRRPNIHYLGMKSYEDLPRYLAGWDAAMLPFAINDATRFISPTKTPEYMAGGKPIVSTPIRDVVRPYGEQGLVRIARTAREFVASIGDMQRDDPAARLAAYDAFLADMSWDATFERMLGLVENAARDQRMSSLSERFLTEA